MMTYLNPYLFFNGNCSLAMKFYESCFGGELSITTFGDAQAEACPPDARNKVMHASLKKGSFILMASDNPDGDILFGDNVQIAVNCSSLSEVESLFNLFAANGRVEYALNDTPWGARFGVLIDQFGVNWMFSYDRNKL